MPTSFLDLRQLASKHHRIRIKGISLALAFTMVVGAVLTTTSGCGPKADDLCGSGRVCSCTGGQEECYLGCNSGNCDLVCSNIGSECGTVCADGCRSDCHDTNLCSHSCGKACELSCHNVSQCVGFCGPSCKYSCHDAQYCGVRVGPGSTFTCQNLTSCYVECEGQCDVICEGVSSCNIACLSTNVTKTYGNGTYGC